MTILSQFHSAHRSSRFARRRPQSHRCSRRAQGKSAVTQARLTAARAAATGRPRYAAIGIAFPTILNRFSIRCTRIPKKIFGCPELLRTVSSDARMDAERSGSLRCVVGINCQPELRILLDHTAGRVFAVGMAGSAIACVSRVDLSGLSLCSSVSTSVPNAPVPFPPSPPGGRILANPCHDRSPATETVFRRPVSLSSCGPTLLLPPSRGPSYGPSSVTGVSPSSLPSRGPALLLPPSRGPSVLSASGASSLINPRLVVMKLLSSWLCCARFLVIVITFHLAPTFVAEIERARAQLQTAKARRPHMNR